MLRTVFILITVALASISFGQSKTSPTAKFVIEKAYYNERSGSYNLFMNISIVRPKWQRELALKTWSMSGEKSMMLVLRPTKDNGISFLRIKTEGWNWIPTIERVIKISPSQMAQPWMGSDFSNEDLLKEASIINDYDHTFDGEEVLDGTLCYRIRATPKKEASVIWGYKLVWIGKTDLLERKTANYDEEGTLVSVLTKSEIKEIGGRSIPTLLTMKTIKKEGQTIAKITSGNFKAAIDNNFFTQEFMRNLK